MRLGAFELNEPVPELKEPHALAMLQPWVDIGSVGTLTLTWLETHFKANDLARLARPGDFFDFTRYRPTIYYAENRRQVSVPNTYITFGQRKTGNDFLFIHLLEPHSHGEVYIESVLRLLVKFGVKRYYLIGGVYDYVPHTRPLLVTGGAIGEKAQQDLEKMEIESSDYQGPTTYTYLISQRAPEMGIETMSLIVHLPQYTQLDEDYMGAVRLMKMLGSMYQIPADVTYIDKAARQLKQINQALEKNPELKTTIEQLEAYYETRSQRRKEEESPHLSSEVEGFLREMERRFRDN